MKLWLARHAQPLVAPGICYGRLDVAASTEGTAECAQALAARLPAGAHVASSPLQRCEQLAQALQGLRPDLTYKIDLRLQEMDFGRWEGLAWEDIAPDELQAWTSNFAGYAAGHYGECMTSFMDRVASAFDELREPGATLWITHAGVIRAVELLAQGIRNIERAEQWPLQALEYGQWRSMDLPTG
ncbi:MAG: histidine phosphatase family protein [Polaromonas sp.]